MRALLICLLFYSCPHIETAYAANCEVHPIYCAMVKLHPGVDREHAMKLSNLIHKYAKAYEMDPLNSVAIAMQENAFRDYSPRVSILTEDGEIVSGIGDIGVFQISVNTAIHYQLDPRRLLIDLEYQVYGHFKILQRKTSICREKGLDRQAIACYHSYTPVFRQRYYKMISMYRGRI